MCTFFSGVQFTSFLAAMLLLVVRQDPRLSHGHRQQLAHHMRADALLVGVLTGECKGSCLLCAEDEAWQVVAALVNRCC
jgi:hypothetical protein